MNQPQITDANSSNDVAKEPFGLMDLLLILARHKKKLLLFPLAAAAVAATVSLALPDIFRAGTKLLPPQQAQSGAGVLLAQLGGMAGAASSISGLKNPSDLYVSMLNSRTVSDRIVERFRLKQIYETQSSEKARKILGENTFVSAGKDGLITIEVEDVDKKRAAAIANAYVEELLTLTKVLAVTEASKRRLFYERQLEQSKDNLARAEIKLKQAFDTTGVISVDADSRAIVETIGKLRAQISAKEIQLGAMSAFVTSRNSDYRRVQEELKSLRVEQERLENGSTASVRDGKPIVKPVGLESIKLLRDVKYFQMLYELLAKQYEVARLEESKDSSVIQVLDPAIEPERKFKPKRAIIVLITVFVATLLTLLWVFVSETGQRMSRSPAKYARYLELRKQLKFK